MNFLQYEFDLRSGDVVEVTLDKQANVRLLDQVNFRHYQRSEQHTYHGGFAKQSPVHISAPHAGRWYLVIDLGGYSGTVSASACVVSEQKQNV